MKKTEKEVEQVAIDELKKRYGKGAENKTMNKIWVTGFMVGFVMGQKDALPPSDEDNQETKQTAETGGKA